MHSELQKRSHMFNGSAIYNHRHARNHVVHLWNVLHIALLRHNVHYAIVWLLQQPVIILHTITVRRVQYYYTTIRDLYDKNPIHKKWIKIGEWYFFYKVLNIWTMTDYFLKYNHFYYLIRYHFLVILMMQNLNNYFDN